MGGTGAACRCSAHPSPLPSRQTPAQKRLDLLQALQHLLAREWNLAAGVLAAAFPDAGHAPALDPDDGAADLAEQAAVLRFAAGVLSGEHAALQPSGGGGLLAWS